MVLVVGEAGDLLGVGFFSQVSTPLMPGGDCRTLGRLTGWLAPAKRPMGCMEKLRPDMLRV